MQTEIGGWLKPVQLAAVFWATNQIELHTLPAQQILVGTRV
jgi:hypothetical protein